MLRVQRGMPSSRCVVSRGLPVSNLGFEWRFTRVKPICEKAGSIPDRISIVARAWSPLLTALR
jgi:hypothetical protein